MRQAFLIVAHNEFDILRLLVSKLDDDRNDIYIHLDKKVKELPSLSTQKSKLVIIDNRVDVRWGTTSQIKAEMNLLQVAYKNGPYTHYSIISGTHLPLVSNDILTEYSKKHNKESILKLWTPSAGDKQFKFGRYHFFLTGCYSSYKFVRSISNILWRFLLKVQSILSIRNKQVDRNLIKADQWCMLSQDAVAFLLKRFDSKLFGFKYTLCSDEYFIGTELISEGLPVVDDQHLLYTVFQGYSPRTFHLSEYEELIHTGCMFARKFSNRV